MESLRQWLLLLPIHHQTTGRRSSQLHFLQVSSFLCFFQKQQILDSLYPPNAVADTEFNM